MQAYADLHIHSRYSIASSQMMTPDALIRACQMKGIDVLGSGDALHPGWRASWEDFSGIGSRVLVVPTAEVEDLARVHHLIIMEDFADFSELNSVLAPFSRDINSGGRPHVRLDGATIAGHVHRFGGLIGPAHAFTPWTSLFASFNRTRDCYGPETIDFLELGLSADSSYGAGICDLKDVPFLTNSDAHSPDPAKCGREFTVFDLPARTPSGLISAVRENRIVMNIGFFPEVGKYNRTACTKCFTQYSLREAENLRWRCPADRGRIKKGVSDRAKELSDCPPSPRPPYLNMIPLGEIIRSALHTSSTHTKKCASLYNDLLSAFGNEINVLTTADILELADINKEVSGAVDALRQKRVVLHPGGAGQYGTFTLLPPE